MHENNLTIDADKNIDIQDNSGNITVNTNISEKDKLPKELTNRIHKLRI